MMTIGVGFFKFEGVFSLAIREKDLVDGVIMLVFGSGMAHGYYKYFI